MIKEVPVVGFVLVLMNCSHVTSSNQSDKQRELFWLCCRIKDQEQKKTHVGALKQFFLFLKQKKKKKNAFCFPEEVPLKLQILNRLVLSPTIWPYFKVF